MSRSSSKSKKENDLSFYDKNGEQLWLVEKILDKKIQGGKTHYKIKWQGFSEAQSTWEPASNVVYVQDMIDDFENKHPKGDDKEKKSASPSKLQASSKKISKTAKARPTRSSRKQEEESESETKKSASKTSNTKANKKALEEAQLSIEQSGGFNNDTPLKIAQHGLWDEGGIAKGLNGKEGLQRVMFQVQWKKRKDGTIPTPNYYRYSVLKKKCPVLLLDYIEGLVTFG